jgi:hypothetical protein
MTESSTGTTMRWAAAQALTVDAETAARSIGESLAEALGPKPDLLLIFFTAPLVPPPKR